MQQWNWQQQTPTCNKHIFNIHNTLLAINNNNNCNMQNTIAIQHHEIMNAIQMGDCNTRALLDINMNAIHNREYNTQRNMLCIIVLALRSHDYNI